MAAALLGLVQAAWAGNAALEKAVKDHSDGHLKHGEWCASQGLPGEAHAAFEEALRIDPGNGKASERLKAKPAAPAKDWEGKIAICERKRAKIDADCLKRYVSLGKDLAKKKQADDTAEAFRRALDIDPDSADARQGLGEALVKGVGWFPKAEADKLNSGLREIDGQWKPKEEVEKARSGFDKAWKVSGERFEVAANLTWEEAQRLSRSAEGLARAFVRIFGVSWKLKPPESKMKIRCYATQDEYRSAVESVEPRAVNAPGFYNTGTETAYFFRRDEYVTTVLHECTHQIIHLMASSPGGVAAKPQFWVFEGLASYFETLEWDGANPVFFRKQTQKMLGLKKMLQSGGQFPSLAEFTAMTQEGFMGKQDMYFQALGLVHFMLCAEAGKYRARFLEFTAKVVAGEGSADLFEATFKDDAKAIGENWQAFVSGKLG